MTWKQLVRVLGSRVPTGSVTTYAQVSLWGYGRANRNQPVRSLLWGAGNYGHRRLTNRAVGVDGNVDFGRISPVELA